MKLDHNRDTSTGWIKMHVRMINIWKPTDQNSNKKQPTYVKHQQLILRIISKPADIRQTLVKKTLQQGFSSSAQVDKCFAEARNPKQRDPEVRSASKRYRLTQLMSWICHCCKTQAVFPHKRQSKHPHRALKLCNSLPDMPRQSVLSCCQRHYQCAASFKSEGRRAEQAMAHVEEFKVFLIRRHESAPGPAFLT